MIPLALPNARVIHVPEGNAMEIPCRRALPDTRNHLAGSARKAEAVFAAEPSGNRPSARLAGFGADVHAA